MTDIEQLEGEIEIHQKTGATRRVEVLEKRLAKLRSPEVDEVEQEEVTEPAEDLLKVAYDMRVSGADWKDVTAETGIKCPWLQVSKYAKENELPYSKNN